MFLLRVSLLLFSAQICVGKIKIIFYFKVNFVSSEVVRFLAMRSVGCLTTTWLLVRVAVLAPIVSLTHMMEAKIASASS